MLLDINRSGNVIGVPLTGGVITIYVTNSLGAFVKQRITARVLPRKFTEEELNEHYSVAASLRQRGDLKGSLRLLSAIANVVEDDHNKSAVTENVLGILSQVKLHGLTEIQMVSNVLESIVGEGVSETSGLTPTSAELAASMMKILMKNCVHNLLMTFQPGETVRQREQILSSVLKCSNALLSCSDPILISKSEDAYRTDIITKFQRVISYMIYSLNLATQAAGYYLLPSVDPFVIRTDNVLLWAKVDSIERIMKGYEFPDGENYTIVISPALAKALGARKKHVLFQILSFKRNPYWWSQEEATLETDVLSFKMSFKSPDKRLEPINELPEPVRINFNFKGRKKEIISGSVELPDTDESVDKKDLYVAVHRINPPSDISNGRIYIRFLNLTNTDLFRVQILKNFRPDYESVMTKGKVVNSESSEMYMEYTNTNPDVFNYVGILPGPQATVGVPVNYSFEIFSVHCITRSGVMWTGESTKRVVIILEDNFPGEKWAYLITVQTGFRFGAGTTANVGIQLIGTDGISRSHILRSSQRRTQTWSSDDWFLMFTERSLGDIKQINIWQDYTGSSPDWYCDTIVVHDLSTKQPYVFLVKRWLSLEQIHYSVEGTVKVAQSDEINERFTLILDNTIFGFRESHTWTSILLRHPRSTTRRTDRLAIAMCNVMTTMLTSIMFFGTDSSGGPGIDIPVFSYSLNELIIGLESSLVSMPMTFILLFCFRKSCHINIKIEDKDREHEQAKTRTLYTTLVKKYVEMSHLIPVGTTDPIRSTYEKRNMKWYILSWFMCSVIIGICSFFIILYGLKFGKVKSELWIASVVTAVLHDIFVLTPLKILFSSFLLSLTFNKLYDINSFECDIEDVSRVTLVGDKLYMEKLLAYRSHSMYHPLPKSVVHLLRKKQRRKQRIWLTVEFIMIFILFLIICLIAMKMWTARNYYSNSHVLSLVTADEQSDGISFHYVMKSSRFMDYVTSTLLPALYPPKRATDKNDSITFFPEVHWTADNTTHLLNIPQLRQLRVKQGHCSVPKIMSVFNLTCNPHLCEKTEDKRNYKKYWKIAVNETVIQKHPWTFVSGKYTDSVTIIGRSGSIYHGRGYIAKLDHTHKKSSLTVHDLIESKWIDSATRVVFVELLLYNVNTDMVTGIVLVTECLPASILLTWKKILSVNTYYFISNAIIALLLLFFLIYLFKTVLLINKTGISEHFSHIWHIFEFILIIGGIAFVIVYFIYSFHVSVITEHFQETNEYFQFFLLFYYSHTFYTLTALLICLTTVKILKCCKFGPKFSAVNGTFKLVKNSMFFVFLTLLVIFKLQTLVYFLTNSMSETISVNSTILIKSYGLTPHHSSFLITLNFIVLYSFLSLLSIVLVIYYYSKAKNSAAENSFNYFTFIFNEIKTCCSKRSVDQ